MERWKSLAAHYKLAARAIVGSSTDKGIAALLPPPCLVANSALVEGSPEARPNSGALALVSLLNSHAFSWLLSFSADLNVNLFALKFVPAPVCGVSPFLAHSVLRLSCNHAGYAALWTEQLGSEWREPTKKQSWPVLDGADNRWAVRAAIDAVIADAYGLDRSQYEHVLASFSHTSYAEAPTRCLAAFDELHQTGREAFMKQHDPYWDVPLVTSLPKPVIELPGADGPSEFALTSTKARPAKKRKKRT